jgi:hypothetical protein
MLDGIPFLCENFGKSHGQGSSIAVITRSVEQLSK